MTENSTPHGDLPSLEDLVRSDPAPGASASYWTNLAEQFGAQNQTAVIQSVPRQSQGQQRSRFFSLMPAAACLLLIAAIAAVGWNEISSRDQTVAATSVGTPTGDPTSPSPDENAPAASAAPAVAAGSCETEPIDGTTSVDLDADGQRELVGPDTPQLAEATAYPVVPVYRLSLSCSWEQLGEIESGEWRFADGRTGQSRWACALGAAGKKQLVSIREFPFAEDSMQIVQVHELLNGQLVRHVGSQLVNQEIDLDTSCNVNVEDSPGHAMVHAVSCGNASWATSVPDDWYTMVVGEWSCATFSPYPAAWPCQCQQNHVVKLSLNTEDPDAPALDLDALRDSHDSSWSVGFGERRGVVFERTNVDNRPAGSANDIMRTYLIDLGGSPSQTLVVETTYVGDWATGDDALTHSDFLTGVDDLILSVSPIPSGPPPGPTPSGVPPSSDRPPALTPPPNIVISPAPVSTPDIQFDVPPGERESWLDRYVNPAVPVVTSSFTIDEEAPTIAELVAMDPDGTDRPGATECFDTSLRRRVDSDLIDNVELLAVQSAEFLELRAAGVDALSQCVGWNLITTLYLRAKVDSVNTYGDRSLPPASTNNPCFIVRHLSSDSVGPLDRFAADLAGQNPGQPASVVASCARAMRFVYSGGATERCVASNASEPLRSVHTGPVGDGHFQVTTVEPGLCGVLASQVLGVQDWLAVLLPDERATFGWLRADAFAPIE